MLNRFFAADEVIGDEVVYVGANSTRVPTEGNAGGWKNGSSVIVDPEPASDALECISWEPTPAAAKAAALLAAAADVSVLE